jgi:CrcB protein
MVDAGRGALAVTYLVASLLLGLVAVGLGVSAGERVFGRRRQ